MIRWPKAQNPSYSFLLQCSMRTNETKMAESERTTRTEKNEEGEEDYMGDLSQFLPPETTDPPSHISTKKTQTGKTQTLLPSKKKLKANISWQEKRKLEREKKQQEEDEQTLAKIEAPIPESNIGFKLLKQMGFNPDANKAKPVGIEIRRTRVGIGREDPYKEKRKREEIEAERKRRKEEDLMADFGLRQKSQWRSRRVVVNFRKARAALDQLENKEVVVEPKKSEDGEDHQEDEEEEEEITEEDLQEILMKLRDEHRYCLFCGFQYETAEELLTNCPGIDEDDH